MLKRLSHNIDEKGASVKIGNSEFPKPFKSGLEFNAPVHGTWNIVHMGMLVPESHAIYACGINCNRGVVMTAAEMAKLDRFSTITIEEKDVLYGDMEKLLIDGVTDVLNRLSYRPRMIMLFPSCIHHFMGTSMKYVYNELNSKFPDVYFAECWMDPTMQKRSITPEQRLRREMYCALEERKHNKKSINIIGNDISIDKSSELVKIIDKAGCRLRDITECSTFDEYLHMSESYLNIVTQPAACIAGKALEKRLNMKYMYLPLCYGYDEIKSNLEKLAWELDTKMPDADEYVKKCEKELKEARELIGDTKIAIDYTFSPRPLGLARLLTEHGFNVERVYLDAISAEEEKDYLWLKDNKPELMLYATIQYKMRVVSKNNHKKYLAIGQKAAYFTGTNNFVNAVEGGGMYGFNGIVKLCGMMKDAFLNEKDARDILPRKGLGCDSIVCDR